MPELRENIATREWVIIATERAKRPDEFRGEPRPCTVERPERVATCPFCPGNEAMAGTEVYSAQRDGAWRVRVLKNKYPALSDGMEPRRSGDEFERRIEGFGVHEVLVESPRHNATPALQADDEVLETLRAFRARGQEFAADARIQCAVFFKNHGVSAGTSLEHPHGQLVGLPVVPRQVRERLREAATFFDENGACVYCEMLRREQEAQARVVVAGEHFSAFVPYAAFSPFHMWIMPHRHAPLFIQTRDEELADLARVLRSVLARLYHGLCDPDFNYVIRTAPHAMDRSLFTHWYLSIVPKVTRMAGFEIGSGMFINTALPEESARFLREVSPDAPPAAGP